MGRRKLSTTIYITPAQDAALKALHARTKVPVAEYIRQGIDAVLTRYGMAGGVQPTDRPRGRNHWVKAATQSPLMAQKLGRPSMGNSKREATQAVKQFPPGKPKVV